MNRISVSALAALALISCLCLFGCGKDTTETPPPPDPPKTFKPLTDKADVIANLALAYNQADIVQYEKLLHAGYTFYNQERDVQMWGMETFRTREWEVAATRNMFLAAKGQLSANPALNLDVLSLEITAGSWTPIDTVPGLPAPCVDCWTTMRPYMLRLMLTGGASGYTADDLVQITVVPVQEGGKKLYKIYRMDDIAR